MSKLRSESLEAHDMKDAVVRSPARSVESKFHCLRIISETELRAPEASGVLRF
jgi:hypothetical protein